MFFENDSILNIFWAPSWKLHSFKRHTQKISCVFAFLQFPSRKLPWIWTKNDSLEWKLQGFRPAEMAKWSRCWIRKCGSSQLKKNELQLNGVLKRRKRGSSRLRGLSNAWNSVFCCFETWELSTRMAPRLPIRQRLHRKVNAGIIGPQRNSRFGGCPTTLHPRHYV